MKKQTAVDWLWNQLKENNVSTVEELIEYFNEAKKMEYDQIARAWNDRAIHMMGTNYYHETYGDEA